MSEKIVAIIPARGGSKGIPRKNVLDFCGKPLIAWTIIQALETPEIDAVYVTSDNQEILSVATQYGARTIERPADIAGDTATSESAVQHALGVIGSDQEAVLMLEVTSPLRKRDDFSRCVRQFRNDQWDSCFAGALLEDFLIWRNGGDGGLESINYDWKNRGIRQNREPDFVENGSIYMFRPEILLNDDNRFGGKLGVFLIDFWQSFELDEPQDWQLVENLFRNYLGEEYSLPLNN